VTRKGTSRKRTSRKRASRKDTSRTHPAGTHDEDPGHPALGKGEHTGVFVSS